MIIHTDFMGKKITDDSHVIYSSNNELAIGKIDYCTPKMVVITKIPDTTKTGKLRKPARKYPSEVVVVGGKELTWWALNKI
tara:strand:+ start:68 stop:310 length:243 start_codon:yes stop_codon:yes gene_type:complete